MHCSNCEKLGKKRNRFERFPRLLLIQLQRETGGCDLTTGDFINWKKETYVEIKDLNGDEFFLDLTEFASEPAKRARPGGYKYRLVSTLDHTADGGKHYTANSYRPVEQERPETAYSQSAAAEESKAGTTSNAQGA